MESFFILLQKHMNLDVEVNKISFSVVYYHWIKGKMPSFKKEEEYKHVAHMFMYEYINRCVDRIKVDRVESSDLEYMKYLKFNEFQKVSNKMFLQTPHIQEYIGSLFCKAQKTYFALSRFSRVFRLKKAPIQVNTDLYMNPIDRSKTKSILIYQNGANYVFKISDLIHIFNNALSHSPYFFAEPFFPKNPYTNMEFHVGLLYEIYSQIKTSDYKMPILIHAFYLSGFDLDKYAYENEALIRDVYIEDYVKKSTNDILLDRIHLLFRAYDKRKVVHIDPDFPNDRLVSIMRPYLRLKFINEYSLSHTSKRDDAGVILLKKMKEFIKYNPKFGRKYMKKSERFPGKYCRAFNDDHPVFYENDYY